MKLIRLFLAAVTLAFSATLSPAAIQQGEMGRLSLRPGGEGAGKSSTAASSL